MATWIKVWLIIGAVCMYFSIGALLYYFLSRAGSFGVEDGAELIITFWPLLICAIVIFSPLLLSEAIGAAVKKELHEKGDKNDD